MTPFETLQQQNPWPAAMPSCGPQMHGWCCNPEGLARLVKGKRYAVELGSWWGKSAKIMVEAEPELRLICIDHWKGSDEHIKEPHLRALIAQSYDRFICNLWPYRDRVVALIATTMHGLGYVADAWLHPELIYIDAGHDFTSVWGDITLAAGLFPEAQLCGDDYGNAFPDVRYAVNDASNYLDVDVEQENGLWWFKHRLI